MDREYIKMKRPTSLPYKTNLLRKLDDDVWLDLIFYHILVFYKHYDIDDLKMKINEENTKEHSRVEKLIAKYIRKYLRNNREFDLVLDVNGEPETECEIEGYYDIKISNTYWNNKKYLPLECKILNSKQDSINKYVFYKKSSLTYDGGIYRYFNGKYAQNQNFGGMLGFVLDADVKMIKEKVMEKMKSPFNDITPEGDLLDIEPNFVEENDFTFSSLHRRNNTNFKLYHFLLRII